MTATPPSASSRDGYVILRAFLLDILPPGVEVFQGQANRVPEPVGPDFVMMTEKRRGRLATNVETWPADAVDPDAIDVLAGTKWEYQIDVHGPAGPDFAQTLLTLWRGSHACKFMAASGFQPLYAEDPVQMPFTNGEKQIETRWIVNLAMQANPVVSTAQDFADTLTATLLPISGA